MATIKYRVRSAKTGRLATVYLRFKDGIEIDLVVPTAFKTYPEYWNNTGQTFKQRITFTDGFTEVDKNNLSSELLDLRNLVLKKYNQLSTTGKIASKEWLISVVDAFHNKTGGKGKETLNEFIDRFIKEIESGRRLYTHNNRTERYKPGTTKNYKGFQEQFNLFQNEKGRKFNFDDITIDLYDQLVVYFNDKSYSPNTIGRHIKNLKVIMRVARDNGMHNNNEMDRKKFKSMKVTVNEIYLDETELNQMLELDLSGQHEKELARDVFLIGCYTAQRFSDYSRIRKENIRKLSDGTMVIDIIQKKTGEQVLIPMRLELIKLLEKYEYNVPKIFEQKLNKRIKDVGEDAKITMPVIREKIQGGLKVASSIPKNKLIKTHTARRSGCTNMYLGGVPTLGIMKISGHKTEREFLSYIKTSKEQTAQTLNSHPYFTQRRMKVI
jgi:integrase